MSQWGFYFDQSRCVGCKTCVLACKQWNEDKRGDALINTRTAEDFMTPAPADDSDGAAVQEFDNGSMYIDSETGGNNYKLYKEFYMKESWRRMESYERGLVKLGTNNEFIQDIDRRYLSVSCNHCSDPSCLKACPMANIYKDETTGAVLRVSAENCISCGRCKDACPWDAPQFYDENFASYDAKNPKRPRMTKCTLCKDRISEGLKPACVAACWNRALDAGPMEELRAKYPKAVDNLIENDERKGFPDALLNKPNVIFKKKG